MELKPKLIHVIQRGYEEERYLVSQLSEYERSENGSFARWSIKDLIAHLAAWREHDAANIDALEHGETPTSIDDVDSANATVFESHCREMWEIVLNYAQRSHDALLRAVQSLSSDTLKTMNASWEADRPLWQVVASSGYVHPLIHLAERHRERGNPTYATDLWEEASGLLMRLSDDPHWQGKVIYNLACAYAQAGRLDESMVHLREGLRLSGELADWSRRDPDLEPLRGRIDYRILLYSSG